jgi:hypothetical protein
MVTKTSLLTMCQLKTFSSLLFLSHMFV